MVLSKKRITKALIRLRRCTGWSAPVLFTNPGRQVFSRRGPNYTKVKDINDTKFAVINDTRFADINDTKFEDKMIPS